jgi:hypothetical protein
LHSNKQVLPQTPLGKDKEEKEVVLLVLVVVEKGQWQKRKDKKCGERESQRRSERAKPLSSCQNEGPGLSLPKQDNAARKRHAMLWKSCLDIYLWTHSHIQREKRVSCHTHDFFKMARSLSSSSSA